MADDQPVKPGPVEGGQLEVDPAGFVTGLLGQVPVALLPVRIETRYFKQDTQLRVRIFPEQLHIDRHEPELTADEAELGRQYWEQRWAGADATAAPAAWRQLAAVFGPGRATWIAQAMTPTNVALMPTAAEPSFPVPDTKAAAWTRAARATALPARWVVVGTKDDDEIFRVWGDPISGDLATTPTPDPGGDSATPGTLGDDELAIDEPMRWVVEYEAAVKAGMAVTIDDDQLQGHKLADGVDRLVVLGVDWNREPGAAAAVLADLLDAHRFTDEIEFLEPGTPTNNTGTARSGMTSDRDARIDASDPASAPAALGEDSSSRVLRRVLGLGDGAATLDRAPNADRSERRTAPLLVDALWESTFGTYLRHMLAPLMSDARIDLVRQHAAAYLMPGGPLPALRIGAQPYGVLPVIAPLRWQEDPHGAFQQGFLDLLERLRRIWSGATTIAPRMGRSDDPDTDMLELLQRAPLASTLRYRRVFGPLLVANSEGLEQLAVQQQHMNSLLWFALGLEPSQAPFVRGCVTDALDFPLTGLPRVQAGELAPRAPLSPDYVQSLRDLVLAGMPRDKLVDLAKGDTLLQILLAQAGITERDRAEAWLVWSHQVQKGFASWPAVVDPGPDELINIQGPAAPASVTIQAGYELGTLKLAPDGVAQLEPTVAEIVTAVILQDAENSDYAGVNRYLTALKALAGRPAAELDRALRGVLDCASHRLDAWYTSLATRRLEQVRAEQPAGAYIGGFGWVEDLRPQASPADSLGYIHAPSLAHAATAAILRSGHLAHSDDGAQPMAIDLSSDRVRTALELLRGVAEGQQLAALLGYRFERSLRDHGPEMARYILPLRRVMPLRPPSDEPGALEGVESIAARDVIDGVALVTRWREKSLNLVLLAEAPADEVDVIYAELDRLAGMTDAVSDLLVAEATYQTVLGNPERAQAALAAIDRQQRPVDPQVMRTPRSGTSYQQRVVVAIGKHDELEEPDLRSLVEPRLNAWLAHAIGDLARFQLAATARIPQHDETPAQEVALEATLGDLRLSALSLVMASVADGPNQATELEEHVAALFVPKLPAVVEGTELVLSDDPPPGSPPGTPALGELRVLLDWLHGFVCTSRPLDARDFAFSGEPAGPGVDAENLQARSDAAVLAVEQAIKLLDGALLDAAGDGGQEAGAIAGSLSEALLDASRFTRGALPRTAATAPDALAILTAQAQEVRDAVARMLDRIVAFDQAYTDLPQDKRPGPSEHHRARVKLVFGESFPLLPQFSLSAPDQPPAVAAQLAQSLADQQALHGPDAGVPAAWLQGMACVRPDVDALSSVLSAAELLASPASARELVVAQLPHVSRQRWAALPTADGSPDTRLAIVAHAPWGLDAADALAGLFCDEWVESVPGSHETSAVTFHYDAPGARAPQAVVLAVPPDATARTWTLDMLLETVVEAARLARIRAVGPKELPYMATLLPAVYLPAAYGDQLGAVNFVPKHQNFESIAKGKP